MLLPNKPRAQIDSLLNFFRALVRLLAFRDDDFQNHWLAVRYERALAAWQLCEERQFHPLHRRLDSSQAMAADQNFVHRENQSELLLLALTFEFGEGKFVMRQQQRILG
jgi:hypothetical protein